MECFLTWVKPRFFFLFEPAGDQPVVVLLPLFLILKFLNQDIVSLLFLPLLAAGLHEEVLYIYACTHLEMNDYLEQVQTTSLFTFNSLVPQYKLIESCKTL